MDSQSLTDVDYQIMFGIKKAAFEELFVSIHEQLRPSLHRSPKNALAIFLAKLRLGISQKLLGFLFGVPQRQVSKIIDRVALLLESQFVPLHLGFTHKDRTALLAENDSEFARRVHEVPPGSLLLVLDGTYLYTEKSAHHRLQKATYSNQKGRNLVKVMVVVTSTGYIVDVVGKHLSTICRFEPESI